MVSNTAVRTSSIARRDKLESWCMTVGIPVVEFCAVTQCIVAGGYKYFGGIVPRSSEEKRGKMEPVRRNSVLQV